ncbi:SusC/RagA family TonB-linked outer membrane protein [Dyadobacter psychrophilus]|uniref:TonB-linked outer membrane protein, SusC/RagA family n=1 Tax=Dyadobacter psychrophilus TaxID=651661 RepID=A0A1T5GWB6_9BACT|nr:TonB-dependent receptor [Dyadobacter psychrophilus]SKC12649.1 TonB-linked outer membrane protein, SusC/RagA family [Dyadobacter psychrophilus]
MKTIVRLLYMIVFLSGSFISYGQEISVSGKVTSGSDGSILPGASVLIKGTTTGVPTDAEGNYAIKVPSPQSVLVFSMIGMTAQEIPVGTQTTINVALVEDAKALGEVVVIGYGTASKRDLTGSIVTIKGAEIADKPSANPITSLQGKVAGLSVVNSGRPGEEPDVRIRGTNSINGVKPVYIVDGILNDNINFINPADIESIEVLKDPSSLAIFGVRGANGAIAVTTKKAKAGQLNVNFNSSVGIKQVADRISMTNAAQFKELYNEQLSNQGSAPYNYTNWTGDTDWQDQIFQNGFLNYNNISISGATEKNRFYMGIGTVQEEGIIKHEKYGKLTLNINDELQVNKNLKFGITFSGYRATPFGDKKKNVGGAILAAPIAPVFNDQYGLYHTLPDFQRAQVYNPLVDVELQKRTEILREYRAVGSIYGELTFLKDLTFRASLYADYGFNTIRNYQPLVNVYNPEIVGEDKTDAVVRQTIVNQKQNIFPKLQQDYLLTYKKAFGDHDLTVLGGITTYYRGFEETSSTVRQGSSFPIPNDPRFWYTDNVGDAATRTGAGSAWESATFSYLGRILYNYKGKYLVNASYRKDGSSAFLGKGRWQDFGAVGLGWVVSEEDFFKNQSVFDYLKVKGSYGVLGNQNIDDKYRYPAYPTLTAANSGVFGENIVAGLQNEYIADPNLHWEKVLAYEGGVEFNMLKNRLSFEANYYNKLTKDILVLVPGIAGTIPGLSNLGEVRNHGFEFAATWNQDVTDDFSYSISGNLTTINNKVQKLSTKGYDIINGASRTTEGFPIGYFWGYVHDGIYQSEAEFIKSPVSSIGEVSPGDIKYKDVNGDGFITEADRTLIGNPTPDFTYGASVSAKYKGFDVGVDLNGVYGNEIFRQWNRSTFAQFNYQTERMGRWNGPGTSNWEPVLNTSRANNYLPSSYWIEDGSFFRIRNVQLGYNFTSQTLKSLRLKSLRLYVNAQNLKTFTNSTGFTPEIGGNTTAFGVDNGTYPVPVIYTFGINLNF